MKNAVICAYQALPWRGDGHRYRSAIKHENKRSTTDKWGIKNITGVFSVFSVGFSIAGPKAGNLTSKSGLGDEAAATGGIGGGGGFGMPPGGGVAGGRAVQANISGCSDCTANIAYR